MDPYVYPETDVLRNLRDIRGAGQLDKFEAIATTRRIIELEHEPSQGGFDARHLQAIHRYIFQDVYEWAGEFRTVSISKSGDPFAFPQHIASSLEKIYGELLREPHLAGSDTEHFASRGAYYLGEFIRELGLRNGFIIDWKQISREEMIEASRRSLRIDNTGLERVLRRALTSV